jgi:competence protein ComEC
MKAGELISIGDINIQCLWPNNEKIMVESIPNNASVVNLITIKNASFLLTGDIEPPAQEAIRNLWKIPPVDIVKVPHHGSKFQDRQFPHWTGARLALVSAGKENSYGHPSSQAIDLYQDSGMKVLTTDVVGSIAIKVSDDDSIQVSTQD